MKGGFIVVVMASLFSVQSLLPLSCRTTNGVSDARSSITPQVPASESRESNAPAPKAAPSVTFHREGDSDLTVTVDVVADEASRARGLMHRKSLGTRHGMLFVFDREENHTFWMKNTFIPLDMIFVDSDSRIVGIVKRAVPHDETSRGINRPSRFVVEVNAGFADEHRIRVGSRVTIWTSP